MNGDSGQENMQSPASGPWNFKEDVDLKVN